MSVPVPGRGWCQTWVDSQGNYLDFVGGWTGSTMILDREHRDGDVAIAQRMTWRDVTADSLTWEWLGAEGDSEWQLKWRLDYRRR